MSKQYQLNKTKYLNDDERTRLIETLDFHRQKEFRDTTLIRLALETGARATEILNITRDDLCLQNNTVFIKGIKGSNDREIPIPDQTMTDLVTITNKNPMQDKIFNISYKRFFQIWQNYAPNKKKLHSLRHTFALRLYKRTKDIRLTMTALGHRKIANTMIYVDYAYSQEELKQILEPTDKKNKQRKLG